MFPQGPGLRPLVRRHLEGTPQLPLPASGIAVSPGRGSLGTPAEKGPRPCSSPLPPTPTLPSCPSPALGWTSPSPVPRPSLPSRGLGVGTLPVSDEALTVGGGWLEANPEPWSLQPEAKRTLETWLIVDFVY